MNSAGTWMSSLEKLLLISDDCREKFEIGRILHLKSEIQNLRLDCPSFDSTSPISSLGFRISDAGFVQFQIFLLPFQLIRQRRGVVDLPESFDNRGAMHGDGSVRFLQVDEIPGETLDVAVEDKTDELAVAIDNGRSGIPPDDIRRHDEIERGGQINFVATLDEPRRQVKRRLVIKACRAIKQAVERRL